MSGDANQVLREHCQAGTMQSQGEVLENKQKARAFFPNSNHTDKPPTILYLSSKDWRDGTFLPNVPALRVGNLTYIKLKVDGAALASIVPPSIKRTKRGNLGFLDDKFVAAVRADVKSGKAKSVRAAIMRYLPKIQGASDKAKIRRITGKVAQARAKP